MLDPVLLVVYALAVASVTGLVTSDSITEDLRDRLISWLDDRPRTLGSYVAKLVTCPWCAGMWISAAAAPMVWFWGQSPWLIVPALAFAFRQVAGMTSNLGR
jgi:fatty acid desaturase